MGIPEIEIYTTFCLELIILIIKVNLLANDIR
jgi:hypothetical protein